jgi:hypothetical protein
MTFRTLLYPAALTGVLIAGPSMSAHHSFALFEMDKDVTYKGVVTEYKWINPHTHITVDIKPGPVSIPRRSAHGMSRAGPRTSWDGRAGRGPRSSRAIRSLSSATP